jgi:hypothetical protein
MGYPDEDEAKHRDLAGLPGLAFVIFFTCFWFRGKFSGFFLLGLGVIRLTCIFAHE